jgi:Zn-dependent oligopeptidase
MTKKKMGGLGKLSQFSGIKSEDTSPAVDEAKSKPLVKSEQKIIEKNKEEKLVNVNIKITKTQKDWLAEIASLVRDNNTEPVPPSERVYPQHLIGLAIDLLNSQEVDWVRVKNIEDLREQLNI